MKESKADKIWIDNDKTHSTKIPYDRISPSLIDSPWILVIFRFIKVLPDDVLSFLNSFTNGKKRYTKRVRYSHLSAFFNFFRNNIDTDVGNPCDTPMIRKLYRERVVSRWEIIEKETVDEIVFRTVKVRNRLILELMARGGMRIGEVLKLRLNNIQDRKLIVASGRICFGRLKESRRTGR